MQALLLKDAPKGEFIKRTPTAKKVYTRGDYDRSLKRYRLNDWDDISRELILKGDTVVYIDFEF